MKLLIKTSLFLSVWFVVADGSQSRQLNKLLIKKDRTFIEYTKALKDFMHYQTQYNGSKSNMGQPQQQDLKLRSQLSQAKAARDKAHIDHLQAVIALQKEQYILCKKDAALLQAKIARLTSKSQQPQAQKESSESELDQLRLQNEMLEEQVSELEYDKTKLEKANQELTEKLATLNDTHDLY